MPKPYNEKERLKMLYETKLLYSDINDPDFDRYTSLTSRILNIPICSVSLVDSDKVWYKSKVGIINDYDNRDQSFAKFTILPENSDVFVIEDTFKNEIFKRISLSRESMPITRFYAGAALIVEGIKIGSLCISDIKPHPDFNLQNRMNLMDFAAAVSTLIAERRRAYLNENKLDQLYQKLSGIEDYTIKKENSFDSIKMKNKYSTEDTSVESTEFTTKYNSVDLTYTPGLQSVNELDGIISSNDSSDIIKNNKSNDSYNSSPGAPYENTIDDHNIGYGVRCNIFDVIEQAKKSISEMTKRCMIEWLIDRDSFELGQHICHPDVVCYLLTSTVTYFASKWSKIYVFVGFKKNLSNRNHKRSLHTYHSTPGLIDGNLNVKVCIKSPAISFNRYLQQVNSFHKEISTSVTYQSHDDNIETYSHDMSRTRRLIQSKYDMLEKILRDIGGTSRVTDFYEVIDNHIKIPTEVSSIPFRTPDNYLRDRIESDDSGNNSSPQDSEKSNDQSIISERLYDYTIPFVIEILPTDSLQLLVETTGVINDMSRISSKDSLKKTESLTLLQRNEIHVLLIVGAIKRRNSKKLDNKMESLIDNNKDNINNSESKSIDKIDKSFKSDKLNSPRTSLNDNNKFNINELNISEEKESDKYNQDDDYNYNLIKLLKSQGYQLTVLNKAEEGIELLKTIKFDIAFIDITLKTTSDISVLQGYHSYLHDSINKPENINCETLIIGISGPNITSSKPKISHSSNTSSLSSSVASSSITYSLSSTPKNFSNLITNKSSIRPVDISITPPTLARLNWSKKVDNILPTINIELLQLSGFNYGMHFYFPNPSDDIHLLVFIMSVRRKHPKVKDILQILENKLLDNSQQSSNVNSMIGSLNISSKNSNDGDNDDEDDNDNNF